MANIDMRNNNHTCPSGLSLISSPKRLCDVTNVGRYASNSFSVQDVQYTHVCGKIIGYQNRALAAFMDHKRTINSSYVFGASLTNGENPRQHLWTFAGAMDESRGNGQLKCFCIKLMMTSLIFFRGSSYSELSWNCDTALRVRYNYTTGVLQLFNPLWDGKGCGRTITCYSRTNTCCSFNTPPWFVKGLPPLLY